MTKFEPDMWEMEGRPAVPELSGWKQFFCLHKEKDSAPFARNTWYSDLSLIQCEDCGFWHYPKNAPSGLPNLFRHMAGMKTK